MENPADYPGPVADLPGNPVSLLSIGLCFLKLGVTSFGGGAVGWIYREVVENQRWMSDQRFLKSLAIAQILPGANVVNITVYVGMTLRGPAGAAVAAAGIVTLPLAILLLLGSAYEHIAGDPVARSILSGLLCVGLAAMLSTCLVASRQLRRHVGQIFIAATIFLLVGILRWPMIWVVLVMVPVSILGAYYFKIGRSND
jgi:chromate transporter